jgi:hypothetical protein
MSSVICLQVLAAYFIGLRKIFLQFIILFDRLCGLVARVPGYRSRDPGFDTRGFQIF